MGKTQVIAMGRSTPRNMSKTTILAVTLCGSLFCCASLAELNLTIRAGEPQQKHLSTTSDSRRNPFGMPVGKPFGNPGGDPFTTSFHNRAAGIDQYNTGKGLRVRGWQFGNGVYFGQAKVGKKWGVGVIVDRGQYVYGINNRGIQLLLRL